LLATVAEKAKWDDHKIIRKALGSELASLQYQHPFCNRTGKLFAANFVESSTGTGFVHIAPGHGLDDYNLGRQNNLPIYSPVDDDGALAYTSDLPREQQMPQELVGKSILEKHGKSDANEAVLHELRLRHALLHQENYHHSYPFCWRSKTPIIFRAMDQWFIAIDHVADEVTRRTFRQQALEEIDRVKWVPEWGVNRIKGAVESRPDWCISRQRTWGVPIPAFYDTQNNPSLDAEIVRNTAKLIEQHGSNVWFEKSVAELWALVKPANWNGADPVAKSNDTLDVWIDSGSSSRAVLMRRSELLHPDAKDPKRWQADVYLEGSDQHRGWFQSSLLLSLAGNGAAPFRTVLTHGFMVDADREKISKSKQGQGAYEKPQTAEAYVNKYGADIVRLWVASQDYHSDIVVSDERVAKVSETYRNLRNTLRYQLSNLYDFDPTKHFVTDDKLTGLDRWILAQFANLQKEVLAAYDNYEFHVVYQKISQFAAVELSSIYHDIVKDRLYTDAANSHRRRSTQTALHRLVTGLCLMLAPVLVFTADEAWEFIPNVAAASVHLANATPETLTLSDSEKVQWEVFFSIRDKVLPVLEKGRQEKLIGKALEAKVELFGVVDKEIDDAKTQDDLREVLNVSQLKLHGGDEELRIVVSKADGEKCERCWHFETTVGQSKEHPTICARCVDAIQESRG
jgi:isoleucyl-tRNA synthetase